MEGPARRRRTIRPRVVPPDDRAHQRVVGTSPADEGTHP